MIRIKSFDIKTQGDEADKFLQDHQPIKQGGIQYNMGFVNIIYDDGVINLKGITEAFAEERFKEIKAIEETKHNILKSEYNLNLILPKKGYKELLTDFEVKQLCLKEGDSEAKAKERTKAIFQIKNDILTFKKNIERAELEIKFYNQTIESYNK